jgi:Tfp pilus assembly protein PilF
MSCISRQQNEAINIPSQACPKKMSDQLLQRAITTLKVGRRVKARRLLDAAVQTDPHSERGWLWLAEAVDSG